MQILVRADLEDQAVPTLTIQSLSHKLSVLHVKSPRKPTHLSFACLDAVDLEIYFARVSKAVLNELISGLTFASSAGPLDELAIAIPWYKPIYPMLEMFEALKVACSDGVEDVFLTFHPLLGLSIESRDHPNPVG